MLNKLQELEIQEAESFLYQEIDEELAAAGLLPDRFKITNLEQANWALRKIRAFKAKAREINSLAEAEIERIKSWQDSELKKIESSIKFFEMLLEEYHRSRIVQNPKEKTITTPYGKMQIKKILPKWNYDDNKLLEWLKKNKPEFIRIKEEPNKQELKKVLKVDNLVAIDPDTGEVVEGITIEPETDKFIVEVD
ncbi:MAG: host-nuclease inhibitor Gam family protein [Thermovenabulum sp.]|uniref:host-nuclease inhibitor Gam family protein n=1 Tax=Thermovenabulum sp. TaxID=3100335 RepID=UPI003C7C8256